MNQKTFARVKRLFIKTANGQIFIRFFPEQSFALLRKKYQAYIRKCAENGLPFIIRIEYGGLGDHINYSALPEAIFRKYGVKTQISLDSAFNSPEIKNFVWGNNPYISFTSQKGKLITPPNVRNYRNYNEILLALLGLDGP